MNVYRRVGHLEHRSRNASHLFGFTLWCFELPEFIEKNRFRTADTDFAGGDVRYVRDQVIG